MESSTRLSRAPATADQPFVSAAFIVAYSYARAPIRKHRSCKPTVWFFDIVTGRCLQRTLFSLHVGYDSARALATRAAHLDRALGTHAPLARVHATSRGVGRDPLRAARWSLLGRHPLLRCSPAAREIDLCRSGTTIRLFRGQASHGRA